MPWTVKVQLDPDKEDVGTAHLENGDFSCIIRGKMTGKGREKLINQATSMMATKGAKKPKEEAFATEIAKELNKAK